MKADFFIELYPVIHDREVVKFSWFSPTAFIPQMLSKYMEEPRTIKAVTDFRLIKQHIVSAKRANALGEFSKRLKIFGEDHARPLKYLEIEEANIHAEARNIVRTISTLEQQFSSLDAEEFYGEEALWESVRRLVELLTKKLREADKRL